MPEHSCHRPAPARLRRGLALALALSGCTTEPPMRPTRAALAARSAAGLDTSLLEADLEQMTVDHAIPGLAIALVHSGRPVWGHGVGLANQATEVPVTIDTPFMLASVSKTVVGAALAQAHVSGLLDLDQSVATTTGLPLGNPLVDDGRFTLRHLATHSAGVRDNWDMLAGTYVLGDSPISLGELVARYFVPGGRWYDAEENFAPDALGSRRRYSNLGTALAGWTMEPATGLPLDDWCDAELFPLLGMDSAGWHLEDHDPELVAMPYGDTGDGEHFPYGHYGYPDWPDGQLRASASDLAQLVAAMARPGGGLDNAVRAELLHVPFPQADDGQALFWKRRKRGGRSVWAHSGDDAGVATEIFFDAETGHGVVVLMNADWNDSRRQALRELQGAALDLLEASSVP